MAPLTLGGTPHFGRNAATMARSCHSEDAVSQLRFLIVFPQHQIHYSIFVFFAFLSRVTLQHSLQACLFWAFCFKGLLLPMISFARQFFGYSDPEPGGGLVGDVSSQEPEAGTGDEEDHRDKVRQFLWQKSEGGLMTQLDKLLGHWKGREDQLLQELKAGERAEDRLFRSFADNTATAALAAAEDEEDDDHDEEQGKQSKSKPTNDVSFTVLSSDKKTLYTVDPVAGTCTCPDFRHRGHERQCKHLRELSDDPAEVDLSSSSTNSSSTTTTSSSSSSCSSRKSMRRSPSAPSSRSATAAVRSSSTSGSSGGGRSSPRPQARRQSAKHSNVSLRPPRPGTPPMCPYDGSHRLEQIIVDFQDLLCDDCGAELPYDCGAWSCRGTPRCGLQFCMSCYDRAVVGAERSSGSLAGGSSSFRTPRRSSSARRSSTRPSSMSPGREPPKPSNKRSRTNEQGQETKSQRNFGPHHHGRFTVDDRIEAQFEGGAQWYLGRIANVHDDPECTVDINYDDGDREWNVLPRRVRLTVYMTKGNHEKVAYVSRMTGLSAERIIELNEEFYPGLQRPGAAMRKRTRLRLTDQVDLDGNALLSSKRSRLSEGAGADPRGGLDDDVCRVCQLEHSPKHNQIVYCENFEHCGTAVHQKCYGIGDEITTSGREWWCELCQRDDQGTEPRCAICARDYQAGPMKTCGDVWVHPACLQSSGSSSSGSSSSGSSSDGSSGSSSDSGSGGRRSAGAGLAGGQPKPRGGLTRAQSARKPSPAASSATSRHEPAAAASQQNSAPRTVTTPAPGRPANCPAEREEVWEIMCVPCLRACVPACLRACVPACLRACVPACKLLVHMLCLLAFFLLSLASPLRLFVLSMAGSAEEWRGNAPCARGRRS